MTKTRTRSAAVAVCAALALTACGGGESPTRTSEPVITAPSAGSPTSTPTGAPAVPVASFAADDPAVLSFGAERVQQALVIAQDLAHSATANVDLLDAERDSADQIVSAVDTYLTGEGRTRLAEAAASSTTDATQPAPVEQLVIAAYGEGDLQPVSPYLSAWDTGDYAISVDGDGLLVVNLRVSYDALYEVAGEPTAYPVVREQAYTMVPSPEGTDGPAWLVDDWASSTEVGDPR